MLTTCEPVSCTSIIIHGQDARRLVCTKFHKYLLVLQRQEAVMLLSYRATEDIVS